jgi:hypothetical protein
MIIAASISNVPAKNPDNKIVFVADGKAEFTVDFDETEFDISVI